MDYFILCPNWIDRIRSKCYAARGEEITKPCRCRSAWINKQINVRTMGRAPFHHIDKKTLFCWAVRSLNSTFIAMNNSSVFFVLLVGILLHILMSTALLFYAHQTANKLWLTKWLALKCLWVDRGRMKAPVDRSCVINKVVRLRKGKRARVAVMFVTFIR